MAHNRWQTAIQRFEQAEQELVSAGRSASHVYHATRPGTTICLFSSGQLRLMHERCESWLAEAQTHGDHFGEIVTRQLGSYRFFAIDDPRGARSAINDLRAARASDVDPSRAESWWLGDAALYEGDFEAALEEYQQARRSPYFTGVQRIPSRRLWTAYFLGRASLLAAARSREPGHLRCAAKQARNLARERLVLAQAAARHIRGGIACLRGETLRAREELERALTLFEECGLALHVEATRHRLGQLYGNEQGEAMMRQARLTAGACGAQNPERWFAMLLPV